MQQDSSIGVPSCHVKRYCDGRGRRKFPIVTLDRSVYKVILSEIIRWNEVLHSMSWGNSFI